MKISKTRIGIQGGVMGWNDPFNPKLCQKYMRTGEKQLFKPQDSDITIRDEMDFIKDLGADFYVHCVMPEKMAVADFIDSMAKESLDYMINNEYGNINEVCEPDTNRYDVPLDHLKNNSKLIGIIYDETEHLQLHPDTYLGNRENDSTKVTKPNYQWANPEGLDLKQSEDAVAKSAQEVVNKYGEIPLFGEYVFPVMHHTLARGGINPCPKILKEEFSSVQISTSLGVAMQYNRKLGICVDLWGQDVGEWFTRLWGFPGHSPNEFYSALKLAYMISPDFMYVENIDVLAQNRGNGIMRTEFGEMFKRFTLDFLPSVKRDYHHSDFSPDIAIIRSDDSIWRNDGNFNGRGSYGSIDNKPSYKSTSVFEIFNLLSNGSIPDNGITTFLPQFKFPHGEYSRSEENLKQLPLMNGVPKAEASNQHKLFYPLNNLAVFDENVKIHEKCNPNLIFLTGNRVTPDCLNSVYRACDNGAKAIIADWLVEKSNHYCTDNIIYTSNFLDDNIKEMAKNFIAKKDNYYMKFTDTTLYIEDMGNGIDLNFDYIER